MRRRLCFPLALLVAVVVAAPRPALEEAPECGPAKGTLVIVGGGNLEGSGILEKFVQLAEGPDANFVIVPTAGGNRNADGTLRCVPISKTT